MKDINSIIQNMKIDNEKAAKYSLNEEAVSWVNHLFKIFEIHISGFNLFASNAETLSFAKQEWVRCFQNERLEKEEVVKGADKIRSCSMKYMISPSEFIDLCRSEPIAEIKPQSDTRNLEVFALPAPERARRLEYGREQLQMLKDMLR